MEGPGMSLFNGAASIHINNSAQDRLEEQEELEDQKRRNEELKHKLANAFDDLLDDDEASSVNSSANFTLDAGQSNGGQQQLRPVPPTYMESLNHLKEQQGSESPKPYCDTPKNHLPPKRTMEDEQHMFTTMPNHIGNQDVAGAYGAGDGQNHFYQQEYRGPMMNNFDNRQEFMNNEQLKVMYEMRVKECQQLAAQMEKLDNEIDSLRARLAAAVNDRDKADLSLQEAHHLLASSKHKMIELEQQVASLTQKLVESDQEKEQLRLELRSATLSLHEVQQRLHTVQVAHTHDTDALFREQQERHMAEVDRLQNDLVKAKTRLDEKDNEVRILSKRCLEKDREKEEILIEKGATINRLASELEAAQSRLVSGESARLKEKVAQLTTERNAAKEQVKELGCKLEITANGLAQCRNKLAASQIEFEEWRNSMNQIMSQILPDGSFGEPASPGKLKDIVNRYKDQVQKISTLQEEIAQRDNMLETHRKQESELRAKIEESKGIEMQLTSKIAVLQNKLDLLGTNSDSELLKTCKEQKERLQIELEEAKAGLIQMELKYAELELEHDKLRKEKGSRASLAQEANADLLRELERCSQQLKDTLKENGELKNLYLQACSARDAISRELKELLSTLQDHKERQKSQETQFVEQIEKEKQRIQELKVELSKSKEETDAANKRISELSKEFTDKLDKYLADQNNAMQREMESCEECMNSVVHIRHLEEQLRNCNVQLASQEGNAALMKELKDKAEFFHNYIMNRFRKFMEQRSVGTSMECETTEEAGPSGIAPSTKRPMDDQANTNAAKHIPSMKAADDVDDVLANKRTMSMKQAMKAAVDLDDVLANKISAMSMDVVDEDAEEVVEEVVVEEVVDDLAEKNALMMKEKAIREQLAERYTQEIKTVEMNWAKKLEDNNIRYLSIIENLKEMLRVKYEELEKLKNFALAERATFLHVLETKEQEISDLIAEYNEMQDSIEEVHDDLRQTQEQLAMWRGRTEHCYDKLIRCSTLERMLKAERDEWKKKTFAYAREATNLKNKYKELKNNLEKLNEEHQTLDEKYKRCKKTVLTYKEYIAKKNDHDMSELKRIQKEYKKIFVHLQNQLNCYVENQGYGSLADHHIDYTEKLKELNEELTKLAEANQFKEPDGNQLNEPGADQLNEPDANL